MNYLLVTHGTEGDVHPFVGIGIELTRRGHHVTLMTNAMFARHAQRHGFDFVPIGTEEEFRQAMHDPNIWKNIPGAKILGRWMLRSMPGQYQAIVDRFIPGQTAIVASGAALGARIAHETHQIPFTMIVLQPAILRSAYDPPVVAGAPAIPAWIPAPVIRASLRLLDVYLDRILFVQKVNDFRAGFGLPPIKRMTHTWWFSPQRVIALFPDWYAPKPPDWPSQLVHAGFPLFDERGENQTLAPDIQTFLDAGDAPIAFTPGSGMMQGYAFFEQAVKACRTLNKRGVLLTRFAQQIPTNLPDSVCHIDYVPFSLLLPRCAALVHHGGIGTLSQALSAGIPQLVMPLAYDQPDNAARLKRMRVADVLKPKHFLAPAIANTLSSLMNSDEVSEQCHKYSAALRSAHPLKMTCDFIENTGHDTPID